MDGLRVRSGAGTGYGTVASLAITGIPISFFANALVKFSL